MLIDPRISFGAPMIKGVPTWVLKGRHEAGESIGDIRDDFSLTAVTPSSLPLIQANPYPSVH